MLSGLQPGISALCTHRRSSKASKAPVRYIQPHQTSYSHVEHTRTPTEISLVTLDVRKVLIATYIKLGCQKSECVRTQEGRSFAVGQLERVLSHLVG
jgi:hypothetical protein